ncbi:hypothetical protein EJB05_30699, partial [Eragrostis curvula]
MKYRRTPAAVCRLKTTVAISMRRWNRRDGNHRRGELGAATNMLKCANFAQTQGKPRSRVVRNTTCEL